MRSRGRILIRLAAGILIVGLTPLTPAQPSDCSEYKVHGLSPGMSYRDVWRVMDGKGDDRGTQPGPSGRVSVAVYQADPAPVRVQYDREISRRTDDARIVMIETKAGLLLDSLVQRLGPPEVGADQIASGRPQSAIVWTSKVCDVEVTVYPDSTGWWQPAHAKLNVRVRSLSYVSNWTRPAATPTGLLANGAPAPAEPSAAEATGNTPSPPTTSMTIPKRVDEAPDADGPYLAGVGGVSFPERIEKLYVEPTYPRVALKGELGGRVLLQAVVLRDGTVAEVSVLSSSRPGYGFEEAAIEAVKQWRFRPATLDGKAVDAYTSVTVDFR